MTHDELVDYVMAMDGRMSRMLKVGTVEDVTPGEQKARIRMGGSDDEPFLGPSVPYSQAAVGLTVHTPVTKGQQMLMISPGGDFRQGGLIPLTFSDENKSPSAKGDENVVTFGQATITLRGNQLNVKLGGLNVDLSTDGATISIGGTTFKLSSGGIEATASKYDWK